VAATPSRHQHGVGRPAGHAESQAGVPTAMRVLLVAMLLPMLDNLIVGTASAARHPGDAESGGTDRLPSGCRRPTPPRARPSSSGRKYLPGVENV
jgi:hypothetical protein